MYAQHVPLMMTTLEAALKGKLKDSAYPAVGSMGGKHQEVRDVPHVQPRTRMSYASWFHEMVNFET